ncbi:MAG TPA: HAMP domain-containing sensor histidine kinase, partial [Polyangiaceae bacterium]|nr:HAMP domain-containing sensor histidine kinase [Polyangiaceae bacterium]
MSPYLAAFGAGVVALVAWAAWARAARARRDAEARAARAEESRELLQAMFDAAAASIVLLSDAGRVVRTNQRAREAFADGQSLEGQNFLALLGNAPPAFREAMLADEDALFTLGPADGDGDTFRLTTRRVSLGGEPHVLLVVEQVTREIRRQEVEVWKKLVRTISHELNNSLAPISSLVHTARMIADSPEHLPKLKRVFETIEDRTRHLQEFIDGYVRFAKLPKPRRARVDWAELLGRIRALYPEVQVGPTPDERAWLDAAQFEQVLINLVKNALEAGSPPGEVRLSVEGLGRAGAEVKVVDRGRGMSDEVLAKALLPFYSTKERGTGLGLALCREIVEAHGGKVRVENR